MDIFFSRVDRLQSETDMSNDDVHAALITGYGYEVADAWIDWATENE
jgi:hypothetical protein